jgi:hypothetical protein
VEAAVECKAFRAGRAVSGPHTNEVIGKAFRVWKLVPVPLANRSGRATERFSIACTAGFTKPSEIVLRQYAIRPLHALSDIDQFLQDLLREL